jgi:hypothetical protein
MHHPGLLPAAMSCARLFVRVDRTKVSNSSFARRDSRMRLFPAFSSLVHIEKNIKQYFKSKLTQGLASPWPFASLCLLHASVPMCGEDQGVKFELFTRSPYAPLSGHKLPRAHRKEDQIIFQGLIHSTLCDVLAYCQLLFAVRICSHVWRGPRCQIRVFHMIYPYAVLSGF